MNDASASGAAGLRAQLQRWLLLAGHAGAPGAGDLERRVQHRMYWFAFWYIAAMAPVYGAVTVLRGNPPLIRITLAVVYGVLVLNALWVQRRRDYRRGLLSLHTTTFFGLLFASIMQVGVNTPAFWWLTVVPFVTILSGHLLPGLLMGAVVLGYAVLSFYTPHVPIADDGSLQFRLHLAVVLSTLYACANLALATLWRRQLQTALEQARRDALAAAAAKARFVANISHEIRTPLAGVIGAAELLRSDKTGPAQRAQLASLQEQSAKALLALVNDVLDWSKLEAGRMTVEAAPVYLRGLVFEANELFAVAAFDKGIELTSSCNPDVPRRFVGDATRIRQIVNNLVSNAVKFTERGGVHVHLALEGEDPSAAPSGGADGRRSVRIEVADSGIGIAADKLARLFDPFEQADESTTRKYGGTGLGLSISNVLARLMGGRIEVSSTPGLGSTFSLVLTLPVAEAQDSAGPPRHRPELLLASASSGLLRHMRALLNELQIDPDLTRSLPEVGVRRDGRRRLLLVDAPLLAAAPDPRGWLAAQLADGLRVIVIAPINAEALLGTLPAALPLYKPVRRGALRSMLRLSGIDLGAGDDGAPAAPAVDDGTPALDVLLCEDNPVNQIIVQAMLTELGARTTLAHNGIEALELLDSGQRFDLVLMDLQMPELDGIAATLRWRLSEAERGARPLPIVAMTANSESEEGAACREAGMDGFLSKPFGIAALRKCLSEYAPTV